MKWDFVSILYQTVLDNITRLQICAYAFPDKSIPWEYKIPWGQSACSSNGILCPTFYRRIAKASYTHKLHEQTAMDNNKNLMEWFVQRSQP